MSAPRSEPVALKATSLRDSLAKTVRLLTRQGIDVQFRGHQPYVASKGNKAHLLVLPELNDSASPELIEAIHGFLDHECGHIFYTPFARAEKAGRKSRNKAGLLNLIEDIRLEKLLPRDLPGTKENLERMYVKALPTFFGPPALKAKTATNPSEAFNCVFIVGLRALSGQKAFQKFMDDENLWPFLKPLLVKMPNISRMLRDLETYDDVEECVDAIIEALKPPAPAPKEKDEPQAPPPPPPPPQTPGQQDDDDDGADQDPGDDAGDDDADDGDSDSDADSDDGEGHGDGEGTDDGNPDDEDEGDSSGDGEGDDTGVGAGEEEDGDDKAEGDDDGDDGDQDKGSDTDIGGNEKLDGKGGKNNKTLTDALKMLEANQRRAIFLYKKRKQTVAEIAQDLSVTEDEAVDLLRVARRRLKEILNGG